MGATIGTHIEKYRPLIMSLVHGRKKSTLARSLVLFVKFGAQRLAAVAARGSSVNKHIPCTSRLRISFHLSACAQSALHQADNLAKLWLEFLSVFELIAQIFCAVSDCENKCGAKQ